MTLWSPDSYIKAWNFATKAHGTQLVPGSQAPYINHVGLVAMEVTTALASDVLAARPDLAVQCALLHDTIEDTVCSYQDIAAEFGGSVADGVLALTKNKDLPTKTAQMRDSLKRIREQPREIWMVKLADRITNLQPPPTHWNHARIAGYRSEAKEILRELGSASDLLASRLALKIREYSRYLSC